MAKRHAKRRFPERAQSATRGSADPRNPGFVESSDALTTDQGLPIADNRNSLKLGERGPTLLEDFILREKITHFDHERIPERIVHARGSGAHGTFHVYRSMAKYTRAGFLQDPIEFPDLVHAAKPEPLLGVHSLVSQEAQQIAGKDPDFHRRDLWEAIESGAPPEYELGVQLIPEADVEGFPIDLLDPTKLVPEEMVPVTPVGGLRGEASDRALRRGGFRHRALAASPLDSGRASEAGTVGGTPCT